MFGSFQIICKRYTISFMKWVVFCIINYIVYSAVSLFASASIGEAQLFIQDAYEAMQPLAHPSIFLLGWYIAF
jgi:hypothetical protein